MRLGFYTLFKDDSNTSIKDGFNYKSVGTSNSTNSSFTVWPSPFEPQNLKEKLIGYSTHRVEVDEQRLKCFEAEQEQAEQELSTVKASLESLSTAFTECLSTKESMMKQIEEKHHDTAASAFCCLYRNAPPPKSLFLSKKGMPGLVALLGSWLNIWEKTMLALVCKSSNFGPSSADYLWFQSKANKLGRSISNRFHVLCLDAMRPWRDGLLEDDPQKKLAMDDPKLPNGDPIPGFKGYAVIMIDMALPELHIQTYLGHGLRETLFYDLFGKLQVYETQKQVEAALLHIIDGGAVSLDGFIAKENGFIYSGRSNPQIHFPITLKENEAEKLRKLEAARNRVKMTTKKIEEEKCSLQKLDKKLKKTNEKYYNATNLL